MNKKHQMPLNSPQFKTKETTQKREEEGSNKSNNYRHTLGMARCLERKQQPLFQSYISG